MHNWAYLGVKSLCRVNWKVVCVCVCAWLCVCVCVRARMCVMSSKLKLIKFNERDDLMSTSGLRTLIAIIREYLKWGSRDSIFSPLSGLLPLRSCVLWVHRVPGWLSGKESTCQCKIHGFNSWVWEDPPEKEMATHYSILWRIPWTEELGGLQSLESQSLTRLND